MSLQKCPSDVTKVPLVTKVPYLGYKSSLSRYKSALFSLQKCPFLWLSPICFNLLFLSLWGRYFFHVHPGHRVPSCDCISRTVTWAGADPESHAHSAFVDFIADSLDVTWAVQIFKSATSSIFHVDYSINSCWSRALCTVKSEIPSPATLVAVIDAELTTPVDTQTCVVRRLLENAFLLKGKSKQITRVIF